MIKITAATMLIIAALAGAPTLSAGATGIEATANYDINCKKSSKPGVAYECTVIKKNPDGV